MKGRSNHYPECRSDRIEQYETPPGHSQYPRHDAVELAQNAKEAIARIGITANAP
jgi:hypothetical protein